MESEDEEIQARLESAGKGLPLLEALALKHVLFLMAKTVLSWDRALAFFDFRGREILAQAKGLDRQRLCKKVLIPRVAGIEDNSRYYSPAMVLWHLIYVGEAIRDGIVALSRGEQLDFTVRIADFKPFVEISPEIVTNYEAFLQAFRPSLEAGVKDKFIANRHAHPWFGPLNPHQWLVMASIHQWVHGRQLRRIVELGSSQV